MYTLIEKVLNVKWFAINTVGNCLYNDRERVYKLDSKEIIYEHPINLQEIYFKGKFFINDLYGKGIYFDNDIKPRICDYFIHLFKDDFVLFSKRDEEERNTFINKIGTNDYYKIKSASTIYGLYGSYLIRKNFELNSVEVYDFPTATPLWQYDLSGLGEYTPFRSTNPKPYEVLKFIDVWQEQLLVACSDGLILCLDIQTGEEIRRFQQCPPYAIGSVTREKFHDANAFVFDSEEDKLMALHSYFYMEIDLNTDHVNIIDLTENMKENNILFLRQSRDYAWDSEYIYSIVDVAHHHNPLAIGDKSLIAFNRKTHKFDWQYIFEDDSVNTDIPQISGNILYQLSANKVLHIFEKEPKPESHEV